MAWTFITSAPATSTDNAERTNWQPRQILFSSPGTTPTRTWLEELECRIRVGRGAGIVCEAEATTR